MSSTLVPLVVAFLLAVPSLLMLLARKTDTDRFIHVTNSFWYPSCRLLSPVCCFRSCLGPLTNVFGQVLLALVGIFDLPLRVGRECGTDAHPSCIYNMRCFL